jgi:hypothetical protein
VRAGRGAPRESCAAPSGKSARVGSRGWPARA